MFSIKSKVSDFLYKKFASKYELVFNEKKINKEKVLSVFKLSKYFIFRSSSLKE